jgi:UDP-N-acetylmuramate--alanine ligase
MTEQTFTTAKNIYFIGIGGIGMSAVARMFLLEGREVHGSDLAASEVTEELEKLGAHIHIGSPAKNLPEGTDLVIYTVAIPETHSEFVAAKSAGISTMSYPESLAHISKDKYTIAVAGTHGKTTTTAMIAKILIDAGLDPTVIVGSMLRDLKNGSRSNFVAGKSKYFVVEACEYKRSFLNIHPDIAVITNIDEDHLDYYKNLEGVQGGFQDFVHNIKKGGTLVTDILSETIEPVIVRSEGFLNEQEIVALDYESLDKISLKVPGEHNIRNAKAAFVVASTLGVPKEKALASLAGFSGTWRRFEEKGQTAAGALVYDDYAHHPTEIAATLDGVREKFPTQKIVVIFQPHLYSRTKEHFTEFGAALARADEIVLVPIYAAREPNDPTVSSELLVEEIKKHNTTHIAFAPDFSKAAEIALQKAEKDDVVITMGAGDVGAISDLVINR